MEALVPAFNEDFHAVVSITLGELIVDGWIDFDDESWKWNAYNDEQYKRMCKKIEGRFFTRELGILPASNWKRRYISFMNEIMPKYAILYSIVQDPDFDPLQNLNEYLKERNIFSEFPQTSLGGNQDYASNGNDREYQRVIEGDVLEKINQIRNIDDVDVMILNDLEILFSNLITVNINYF